MIYKMNILITAIGSFSADCVTKSLKSMGHKVVGCDIYPSKWHAVSKDCDNVYQAPLAINEKDYIDFLLEICKIEEIDVLNPLTDIEIDVINNHRYLFNDIILGMQSEECLTIARNKLLLTELFKKDTIIYVPKSVNSKEITEDFPFPAVAKPVNGRSSEGLIKNLNIEDFEKIRSLINYIVQEQLEGSVFTVDYVRDTYGNDFSISREELLRTKNGAGTTVRIVQDKVLANNVSYIGNKLNIIGCVNMEFIHYRKKYYLIDINPRFSAGIAFSNKIGYDMVSSHFKSILGERINPPIIYEEQLICKRYVEEFL